MIFHNRGQGFVLDPKHRNCIAPGKRPMHTLIPAMAMKDGQPLAAFGVMGANFQPMGHVYVMTNLLDYGLDPQEALDAPRVSLVLAGLHALLHPDNAVAGCVMGIDAAAIVADSDRQTRRTAVKFRTGFRDADVDALCGGMLHRVGQTFLHAAIDREIDRVAVGFSETGTRKRE